jgi:hypothetical protein
MVVTVIALIATLAAYIFVVRVYPDRQWLRRGLEVAFVFEFLLVLAGYLYSFLRS